MTASEFATLVRAKKIARGKWMAKCPAHPDRHPSLSIAEGKKGVLIRCMSHGCDTRDVLKALGLRWSDLFAGRPTREIREMLSLQERRESLERELGLVIWLGAIERGKRSYWAAAERRMRRELEEIRCKIEPQEIYREYRERQFRSRVARLGWERLWSEVPTTQ